VIICSNVFKFCCKFIQSHLNFIFGMHIIDIDSCQNRGKIASNDKIWAILQKVFMSFASGFNTV
jgi:hypothetical protein